MKCFYLCTSYFRCVFSLCVCSVFDIASKAEGAKYRLWCSLWKKNVIALLLPRRFYATQHNVKFKLFETFFWNFLNEYDPPFELKSILLHIKKLQRVSNNIFSISWSLLIYSICTFLCIYWKILLLTTLPTFTNSILTWVTIFMALVRLTNCVISLFYDQSFENPFNDLIELILCESTFFLLIWQQKMHFTMQYFDYFV